MQRQINAPPKPIMRLSQAIDQLHAKLEATYDAFDQLYALVCELRRQQEATRTRLAKQENESS